MQMNRLEGRRLLLVDDEPFFAMSVVEGLTGLLPGLTIDTATDGREALEAIHRASFDLLVTDLRMPTMDGIELLTALHNERIHIPTIVLSAHRTPEKTSTARGLGAFAFLDKPIEFEELVDAILHLLRDRPTAWIEGFTLAGLLQLMNVEQKSARVAVHGPEQVGQLHVRDGELVDAELGDLAGREALAAILGFGEPRVEMAVDASARARTIEAPLSQLLLDVFAEQDERRRDQSAPDSGTIFELDGDDFELVEVEPAIPSRPAATPVISSRPAATPVTSSRPVATPVTSSQPAATPVDPDPSRPKEQDMTTQDSLNQAMQITGAFGAALVDYESGMTLGTIGGGERLNLDVAAAGNTDVVRAKQRVMKDLGIQGTIQDILISLDDQYHIIRPVEDSHLFLYLAVDRAQGNLGMARHKLAEIGTSIQI